MGWARAGWVQWEGAKVFDKACCVCVRLDHCGEKRSLRLMLANEARCSIHFQHKAHDLK